MKNHINNWLITQGDIPGAVAASVVYTDQTRVSQVFSQNFASRVLDTVWQNAAHMALALRTLEVTAPCLRWVFHDAWVYGCVRWDGVCLVILTDVDLTPDQAAKLEALLDDFQRL